MFPTMRNQAYQKYFDLLLGGSILFLVFTLGWDLAKKYVLGW